jgi:streptomycin 6-kinase
MDYACGEMDLPEAFTDRVKRTFGETGLAWLAGLPDLLDKLSKRWSLTLEPHFPELNYNYLAPALRDDGRPVVLKLGVPNPELTSEIAALQHFAGQAVVIPLEADPEIGAILLDRIEPGDPLINLQDDERATAIAAHLMTRLHRQPDENITFLKIADWGKGLMRLRNIFNGGTGPFPVSLVDRAERLFGELNESQGEQVLLHADLHHWNILSSFRSEWQAIDPKGLIGEREYEAGAWLRNPIPFLLDWTDVRRVLQRRVDQFAELLGFDPQRVLAWSQYQAVLSAWWSYEESDPLWEQSLEIAKAIASISP